MEGGGERWSAAVGKDEPGESEREAAGSMGLEGDGVEIDSSQLSKILLPPYRKRCPLQVIIYRKPPDTIRTFQSRLPIGISSCLLPQLRSPAEGSADLPLPWRRRRQVELPRASSQSQKSASVLDLPEIYADAQEFDRAGARGRPHRSSTSPDGEARPHPRWRSNSLFPSALLLGLPPVGLLASLPPTASPLRCAAEEGISLRGQEHSSSIRRCRGPICRCRVSSRARPCRRFVPAWGTSLRLAATSSEFGTCSGP
jgi:hypothetical protein